MTCERMTALAAGSIVAGAQARPLHIRLGVHTQLMGVPDVIAVRTIEGRIKAVPDLTKALNEDLLAKAKASR